MTRRTWAGVRLRAGARRADPLHAADQRLLRGAGLRRALRVGALCRGAVPAAEEAAGASRVAIVTTAAPYQPDKGDQGPGAPYNAAAKFYQVYSGDTAQRPRPAHLARRRSTASTPRRRTPAPGSRCRSCGARPRAAASARLRRAFTALPTNRSHRVTLEVDCPELVARCKARSASMRRSSSPTAPSATRPSSFAARALEAARHRHGRDGLRQGHRRARRRAALPVLGLPARQCRGRPQGPDSRRPSRSSSR